MAGAVDCLSPAQENLYKSLFEPMTTVVLKTESKIGVKLPLPNVKFSPTESEAASFTIFEPSPKTPPSTPVAKRLRFGSRDEDINEDDVSKSLLAKENFSRNILKNLQAYLDVFKTLERILRDSISKLVEEDPTSASVQKLKYIRESYDNFLSILDSLVIKYDIHKHQNCEVVKEALCYLKKIDGMVDQIPPVVTAISKNIDRKHEHVICSFLGLEDTVADFLLGKFQENCKTIILKFIFLGTKPELRDHQSDDYWINLYFDRQYNKLLNIDEASNIWLLQQLGFTKFRARYLADLLDRNSTSDHQTILYLSQSYIRNIFENSILFTKNSRNEENIDPNTNHITTEPANSGDEGVSIGAVTIDPEEVYNENNELLSVYKAQKSDSVDGTTFWFHGTDHQSAKSIAKKGIILSKGKAGGDFSSTNGFYVTPNFSFAHSWSDNMARESSAIVVFKLENEFDKSDGYEMTREDKTKWEKCVTYFRNQCEDTSMEWLDEKKYIFGPISKDGNRIDKGEVPRFRSDETGPLHQLCLKNKKLAKEFYNKGLNIHKVIFFQDKDT